MAKRLKRAFTIVELVIVIAVIAILAAVLIPTFTTLIDKANESNDIALVKNLNTALVSKEATDEVNTMQDALDAAYEYGYTVDKLTPSSSGDIVWDEVNNRFALINDGKVVFGDGDVSEGASLWRIAKNTEDLSDTYSNYLAGEWTTVPAVSTGVDVGTNEGLDVTYTNTDTDAGQTVTIRTNGGTLTVNGPYDTVNHYGMAVKVVVTAVGNNSYHEYGEVLGNIELASGRVVVENNATVSTILVTAQSAESFKVEVNSNATVGTVAATNKNVITGTNTTVPSTTDKVTEAVTANSNFAGGLGTEKSPYLVATAEQFKNIGNYSDEMKKGTSYSFELIDNIDLRTVTFEDEKISAYFCGTLDGNGNQLIASDALKYIFMDAKKVVSISAIDYQLIEKRVQLCGGMDNTWAVNLTFDDVDISTVDAATSILLGENEGLYTNWTGYSNVTGMWTSYYDNKLLIQNCDVAVNISATSYNGVFIGGGLYKTSAAIKNCTYNGSYYGELVNLVQGNGNTNASYGGTLEIENVVNLGGLYGTKRVPLFAAGTGNAEPSSVTIKDSVIGVVRYLKDDTLNISVGSDGTLVISEATAEASNYILTFTGGMRRISEYSENSSYRFSIVLSASFVDKVFNTGLKDGKMATVKQYKEFVDANATFNSSSAMSLYGEEGAKLWIVEKEGTVYYVFEFSDDYIHFENSADESAIVDINKAAITIYDNDDLPIAQAECPLK